MKWLAARWTLLFRLPILMPALILTACASMPLGTMAQLSGYDQNRLLQLSPAELQASVAFSAGFRIEPDSSTLRLDVLTTQGDHWGRPLPLVLSDEGSAEDDGGWFSGPIPVHRYTLKLSDEGADALEQLKAQVRDTPIQKLSFAVNWRFQQPQPDGQPTAWVDLRLHADEAPLRLIDGAVIEFEADSGE